MQRYKRSQDLHEDLLFYYKEIFQNSQRLTIKKQIVKNIRNAKSSLEAFMIFHRYQRLSLRNIYRASIKTKVLAIRQLQEEFNVLGIKYPSPKKLMGDTEVDVAMANY